MTNQWVLIFLFNCCSDESLSLSALSDVSLAEPSYSIVQILLLFPPKPSYKTSICNKDSLQPKGKSTEKPSDRIEPSFLWQEILNFWTVVWIMERDGKGQAALGCQVGQGLSHWARDWYVWVARLGRKHGWLIKALIRWKTQYLVTIWIIKPLYIKVIVYDLNMFSRIQP